MKRQNWVMAMAVMAGVASAQAAEPYERTWAKQIGTGANDYGYDVAADAGGVYLAGFTAGGLAGEDSTKEGYILRYDRAGNLLWGHQIGDVFGESAFGVGVHPSGGAYLTGRTGGNLNGTNAGGYDQFLARYDAGGSLLWTRQLGTGLNDRGLGVSADAAGSVFVAGDTFGSLAAQNTGINKSDAILSRYDQNGNLIWTRQWGQEDIDIANAVLADGTGGALVAGQTRTLVGPNQTGFDAFIRHYDRDGNLAVGQTAGHAVRRYHRRSRARWPRRFLCQWQHRGLTGGNKSDAGHQRSVPGAL